jgi:hypothetical protein
LDYIWTTDSWLLTPYPWGIPYKKALLPSGSRPIEIQQSAKPLLADNPIVPLRGLDKNAIRNFLLTLSMKIGNGPLRTSRLYIPGNAA